MNLNWIPKNAWFGDKQSLQDMIDITDMVRTSVSVEGLGNTFRIGLNAGGKPMMGFNDEGDDEEDESSYLLRVQDGVGIVRIDGSMTDNDSWLNRWFGVVSYAEIRRAVTDAANDPEVESLLLDMNSNGGPVDGVFELAEFIEEVDRFIKPIESMANGGMMSANYLLGSTARKVHATKLGSVGSIGVITIHKEYTEMLKKEGIKVNIIRSGKYKMLVNPYEKLTDEAKQELQDYSDKIYAKFISHVALQRSVGLEEVEENMAQGRVFLGEDAFKVGLVDNLTSIDKLVIELGEQNDARVQRNATSALGEPTIGEDDMSKKDVTLSTENVAKLAAGVPLEEITADKKAVSKETKTELSDADKAKLELEKNPKIDKTELKEDKKVEKTDSVSVDLISYLRDENKELTASVAELTASNQSLETKLTEIKTPTDAMEAIVRSSMDRLAIALGNTGADHTALSGLSLSAAYTKLNAKFEEKYHPGGKASLEVKDETPNGASNEITTARNQAAAV